MGREIREVPANWKHPKDKKGHWIPLLGYSFKESLANWEKENKMWDKGFRRGWKECSEDEWVAKEGDQLTMSFEQWTGEKPEKQDYMPEWDDKEKTCICLYETTTEGTPNTPVFAKADFEKLCEYAEKNCYTFADFRATKEQWMQMLKDDFVHHTQGNVTFI